MNLKHYFDKFELKFKNIDSVTNEWYFESCGVKANLMHKEEKLYLTDGSYSEEWYRARLVWSLVESKMFEPDTILVEHTIPKGSDGAKSLNPDIVIFKSNNWINIWESWDKKSSVPQKIREDYLILFEIKENDKKIKNAIEKQLEEAMNNYIGEEVFGIYLDCFDDILIFRKELANPIKRYNLSKILNIDGFERLNVGNRDNLYDFPSFSILFDDINLINRVDTLNFKTNQPIDEESFKNMIEFTNQKQDKLSLSRNVQDLIVEFLTLKVFDEKEVKKSTSPYFNFYVKDDEINNGYGSQVFRKRIFNLYKKAKEEYKNIFNPSAFSYNAKGENYIPSHGDDEKFLIGIIKIFQKKTILETKNTTFNQIIFNNFGSSINKAKEKQFFTPIPVVKSIVKMINPQKEETICDPCAGICDFLAMAFRYIYKNELENLPTADKFYGFDKENGILKLAELNLVLNGDGNANIKIMNSISQKLLNNGDYKDISFNVENYNKEDWSNINDSDKSVKQYDVVLTNPPFGKNRDLKTGRNGEWEVSKPTMELYETWSDVGIVNKGKTKLKPLSIDNGVIFLENAYKILKKGGRMAIVLSNSITSIEEWSAIRNWFISKMRIVALFDLPEKTFGETSVATTVIIAYKPKEGQENILTEDYEVFVKEIINIGYTVNTKGKIITMSPTLLIHPETFKKEIDENGDNKILTDLPSLVSEFREWIKSKKHIHREIYEGFKYNLVKEVDKYE
jgi:type I restriction enzyme M protein